MTNISSYLVIAPAGSWALASGYTNATPNQNQLWVDNWDHRRQDGGRPDAAHGRRDAVRGPAGGRPGGHRPDVLRAPAGSPAANPVAFNFPANNSGATQVSDPDHPPGDLQRPDGHLRLRSSPRAWSRPSTSSRRTAASRPMSSSIPPSTTTCSPPTRRTSSPTDQRGCRAAPVPDHQRHGEALFEPDQHVRHPVDLFGNPALPAERGGPDGRLRRPRRSMSTPPSGSTRTCEPRHRGSARPTIPTRPGSTLLSQQLIIIDQLAAPTSLISTGPAGERRDWLDRILQDLEENLYSWFDAATGRVFQLNTTYDSVIGYPAGFGSDFSLNDHNFHYGYFLERLRRRGPVRPEFRRLPEDRRSRC